MTIHTTTPGRQLYNEVRAAFIVQGSSLHAWCAANGMERVQARGILLGERNGPISKKKRKQIIAAACQSRTAA